jgi:plastocyanin
VYPAVANDYRSYMVSLGVQFAPPFDTLPPVTASNLNQASIGIGKLAGAESVTRKVKNVGSTSATYTATASVPGFTTVVSPSNITLAPGDSQSFTVTFTRTTAALNAWAIGSLTWTDGTHNVRSPIALQPVLISAPSQVSAPASASGSLNFQATPGFTGTLDTSVDGLVGVTPVADSVVTGAFDAANPVVDADTKLYSVVVPAGAKAARFSLDSNDNAADLDLFVYKGGVLTAFSASGAADEQVTLISPAAGSYDVYVNGFATPGGSTSYLISNIVVAAGDAGNLTVSDSVAVTTGVPVTLTATWTGLDPGKRWLGVISYVGASDVTLIAVG